MKFLNLPELTQINNLLNFETDDCRVEGGIDVYTTKAAGVDKKLYKSIERELEAKHEADVRLSESLSPPHDTRALLSRNSPFGPLDQPAARRTFTYLIATLNAVYPDYDFSGVLRPADFKRERLGAAKANIETTLYNLHHRIPALFPAIDAAMTLDACAVYQYLPVDLNFLDEEGLIWSHNFFFYNKTRKRVCYFYLRGYSSLGSSFGSIVSPGRGERREWAGGKGGSGGGIDEMDWDDLEYESETAEGGEWVSSMDM